MTEEVSEDLASVIKSNFNLEQLYLGYNNLGSSAVVILQALKENSALKYLNLISNNMAEEVSEDLVNVIKNHSNLGKLHLALNNLRSSAIVILQALKQNSKLEVFNMTNDFLTESTAVELVSLIKHSPLITELWLSDNMLQSGLINIATSCNSLTHLQAMELSCNSISPIEMVKLVSVISNIKSLQVLLLRGLVLNVKETFYFSVFQFYNTSKQKVVLQNSNNYNYSNNEMFKIACLEMWRLQFVYSKKLNYNIRNWFPIPITSVQPFLVYAKQSLSTVLSSAKQSEQKLSQLDATTMITSLSRIIKTLRLLDLGYSNVNKEAAVELATALNCNNVLEQLWLRGNVLGADGAAIILTSLQNTSTLTVLDLSYNNITSTSANGIAAVINNNHFLQQLWLDGNMLQTTGVVIIARILKKHSNLRLLSLSNNGITEDAAGEISAIVNSNTLLGALLLSNNQLQSIGTNAIVKSLDGLKFLYVLELTNNCINATAADELTVALSNCTCLRVLYLGNNNLGTTGVVKICQILKNIPLLRVLSLNNSNISTEAANEICNVINSNTYLAILLLGGNDLQTTGVRQIVYTVMNSNHTMELLSLSDNNVDDQVKEEIKVMICDQCDLELLI